MLRGIKYRILNQLPFQTLIFERIHKHILDRTSAINFPYLSRLEEQSIHDEFLMNNFCTLNMKNKHKGKCSLPTVTISEDTIMTVYGNFLQKLNYLYG